jgi:hypothetical protein
MVVVHVMRCQEAEARGLGADAGSGGRAQHSKLRIRRTRLWFTRLLALITELLLVPDTLLLRRATGLRAFIAVGLAPGRPKKEPRRRDRLRIGNASKRG